MVSFIGKKIIDLALQKCEEKNEKRLLDSRSSVHPHQLGSEWTDFREGWYCNFYENLSKNDKFG
jgi:hypothetical protein